MTPTGPASAVREPGSGRTEGTGRVLAVLDAVGLTITLRREIRRASRAAQVVAPRRTLVPKGEVR